MISPQDLALIGFLVFLEGILSIDNAVVLAMLAKPLPASQRKKALTYGLAGAVIFRLIALASATFLMKWTWVKFLGGAYLVFVAGKHFLSKQADGNEVHAKKAGFWHVVLTIELTDIAFAVDSILAAVALSNKFWIVFTGGFIGVVMMRFAATLFLKLLERFPAFETSAYQLVLLIGAKLLVDGFHLPGVDFHSSESPAFWVFWGLMLAAVLYGFTPRQRNPQVVKAERTLDAEPHPPQPRKHRRG
jgi:YkoY family integral membrane protein